MSNLQTLEEIANNLGNMLDVSHPTTPVSIDIGGKTAEQIKIELEALSVDSEQTIGYTNERITQLEKLAEEPSDLTSTSNIQSAAQIIADVKKARSIIDANEETAKQLNDNYKQKLLSESDFESYEDFSTQIDTLSSQRSDLRRRFLGGLRFKGQIKDLSSRINSLYDLSHTQYDGVHIGELGYSETRRFEDVQGNLFGRFANELFAQYDKLASQLVRTEDEQKAVAPAIFESLTDDYISNYFLSRIDEELEANQKRDDHYGREAADILGNTELVGEALSVLRDGLNQSQYSDWNDSDEIKEKAKSLNERLEALPYELRNIVGRGMIRGSETTNDEFTEFADYLTQVPLDMQRRGILTSLSATKEQVLSAISDDDLPYSITGQRWDLERSASHIESSLKSREYSDFLKELDMEKWDVFRNNTGVQEVYSVAALDSFNELIRGEVFDRLLVTPEHTDESVRLGYKALWFKDADSVAYNLLNFWRESGRSGEQPFLSTHSSSENTLGAQYIASLTDGQLSAVEQLKIPGLMEVIGTVKEHPTTFRQSQFIEGDDWIDNPVYEKVQEELGKICSHYLEKGSEREKYFSVGVAVDLDFVRFSDKPSQQRDQLIKVLSERIGLDEHVQTNFKKHYDHFLARLGGSARRMTDLQQYKGGLVAISNYYDDLDTLLSECTNPDKVREEARSMQNDYNYIHEVDRDLPNLINYLRGFDSEIVQSQLVNPEYAEKFKTRLWKVKEQIFRSDAQIDDIAEYVTSDFTTFKEFIDATSELAQVSSVGDVLKSEQTRLLDSLVYSDDLGKETAHIPEYFRALDDNKTATRFTDMDVQTKRNLKFLARTAYNCDESLVVPLTREAIRRNTSYEQQGQIQSYLPRIAEFSGFVDACVGGVGNQKELFDLLYELSIMGEDSFRLVSEIDKGNIEFNSVADSIKELSHSGVRSTSYLVESLVSSDNRSETIANWSKVMDSFAEGNFDSTNELHRNLEYTRFRSIVDHEKVRRHIKNHFTFTDYQSIFDRPEVTPESLMTEQDRFEIDCVAEEARMLRDYVLSVKQRADELGRDVFLVPNLSYGYLPVSPIVEELEHEGVNAIIGVKIGSTESHNNKEVVDSRLFKGYRTNLSNDQPIMVVVDGTKHLVARDDHDKAARYPDAYQGYLNQVIAMNDAMGFTDVDYSSAGKTSDDMSNLRNTPEFQRLVDVYSHVMKTDDPQKERQPYQFGLWNTAGIDLIIRNYHQKIGQVKPTTPEEIEGPAMVFCNVGLLDEQIPAELKERYEGLIHTPAYFDDSGKIINFDFGFDNFGVRYLNTLETEIKKSFGSMHSKLPNGDFVSSLIRYVQNRPLEPVGYEA